MPVSEAPLSDHNKGSLNMGRWQSHLNEMYGRATGWTVFEQDGNTVQLFAHHFHR